MPNCFRLSVPVSDCPLIASELYSSLDADQGSIHVMLPSTSLETLLQQQLTTCQRMAAQPQSGERS